MAIKIKKLLFIVFLVSLGGAIIFAPSAMAQKQLNRKAMTEYRQLFMEIKGQHNKAIKLLISKKLFFYEQIYEHAEALANMADGMFRLFPPDSRTGQSRALSSIWDKDGNISAEFMRQAQIMKDESQKMAQIARTGNIKAIRAQLVNLANNGCRECHQQFRAED